MDAVASNSGRKTVRDYKGELVSRAERSVERTSCLVAYRYERQREGGAPRMDTSPCFVAKRRCRGSECE